MNTQSPMSYYDDLRLYTLSKGRKMIRIYEMMHIAPAEFYAKRQAQWHLDYQRGWEIHREGMAGLPFPLKQAYAKIAKRLGLMIQPVPLVPHSVHDLAYGDLGPITRVKMRGMYQVVNLMAKVSDHMDPEELLKQYVEAMESNRKKDQVKARKRWSFVLDQRNKHAVEAALATPNNVSMIWGASHAVGIIELLKAEGYHLVR